MDQAIHHRPRTAQQVSQFGIGAEFAMPRKSGHDHPGGDAEHDLANEPGDHVAEAGSVWNRQSGSWYRKLPFNYAIDFYDSNMLRYRT